MLNNLILTGGCEPRGLTASTLSTMLATNFLFGPLPPCAHLSNLEVKLEAKDQTLIKDRARMKDSMSRDQVCTECLGPALNAVAARNGALLCGECAAAYYIACAACNHLIALDESVLREGAAHCLDCFQRIDAPPGVSPPADDEVTALVAEYLALHAEERRIADRMKHIKEQLKSAASAKQRIAGAVIFSGEEGAVRCKYSLKLKCDPEKVAPLETLLGPDQFAAMFERKLTFNPVEVVLEEFLARTDDASRAARDAVSNALEKVETSALTVIRKKM